jgi:hypothetical protein
MDVLDRQPFVDALLSAPVGVALLAWLEAEQRPAPVWHGPPDDSDPWAVTRAARDVGWVTLGELLRMALAASDSFAGPWNPDAPAALAAAYRHAPARRGIAEAIATAFEDDLHATVDVGSQQWWHLDSPATGWWAQPRFVDLGHVYCCGEFPWEGLWTVTSPPEETHDDLIDVWELSIGAISRWHLPVRPGVRVWEIHRPHDWVRLVDAYPKPAATRHEGWELPGPNQHIDQLGGLLDVPSQRAARTSITEHLVPDWTAVSVDYDGVHLSWAGLLTSEGYVADIGEGAATMLRYWRSERTLWLRDVFGEPAPLGAPALTGRIGNSEGADVRVDAARRAQDHEVITALLGR